MYNTTSFALVITRYHKAVSGDSGPCRVLGSMEPTFAKDGLDVPLLIKSPLLLQDDSVVVCGFFPPLFALTPLHPPLPLAVRIAGPRGSVGGERAGRGNREEACPGACSEPRALGSGTIWEDPLRGPQWAPRRGWRPCCWCWRSVQGPRQGLRREGTPSPR